jgi:hypothetical protein
MMPMAVGVLRLTQTRPVAFEALGLVSQTETTCVVVDGREISRARIGIAVLHPTVALRRVERDTCAEPIAVGGQIGRALHTIVAIAAELGRQIVIGLPAHGRSASDEVQCAGGRVLAEQRALRTAQNFDALHVEKLRAAEKLARHEDFIGENACRRARIEIGVELRKSSNGELGLVLVAGHGRSKIRSHARHVGAAVELHLQNLLA